MKILLLFTLFPFYKTGGVRLCPENKPFRLNDQSCDNLNAICFKTEDDQCNQLLDACKQCPPSNITLTILRNILEMLKFLSNSTQQIIDNKVPNLFEQSTLTQKSVSNTSNASTPTFSNDSCAILLWIIIIILLVHLLETRFKLLTRFFQLCVKPDQKYSLLQSRQRKQQNINLELQLQNKESMEKWNEKFELKFQEIIDKIDRLQAPSKDIKFARIQFQFDCMDQEPIELYVHNNHNILQVKQQICAKLPHAKHDDYKIMKLKYNGIILNDDNQYLLENIDQSNTIVNCFIDSSMNASDIVVVKLQGKMRLPDIIQINKNQTIDQLQELIGKIINSKDFSLFKEFLDDKKQMKKTLLELSRECFEDKLIDGDCIRIVQLEEGQLIIKSIFDENFRIPAAYRNTNRVSSLIESVQNNYDWNPNNFVLFRDNQYLEEEKYICEYGICAGSPVKICNIAKIDGINKQDSCEKDLYWELYHATKPPNNMKILLKKYKNITRENWKTQDWMLNELKTFLVTEHHQRFIQLFGVYFDETLYVAMENMEEGTLKYYLKKNKNCEKKLIYKWAGQILEGLEYLHQKNVVHRDLNPSNILVNNKIDLKLSSFNLSKYDKIYGPASFNNNNELLKILKVRYMAPELLNGEDYQFQCDIWSFGTILVRIVSGKKPLSNLSKAEAKIHIRNSGTVVYELSTKYKYDEQLKSSIDSCLIKNPNERCKIENLKEIFKKSS